MSMFDFGESLSEIQYRAGTDGRKKMAGVMRPPRKEKCIRCLAPRNAETGKQTPSGFVCHSCNKNSRTTA